MKTYTIKQIVEQLFEVEAETREEAVSSLEDPFSVKVIKVQIIDEREEK